MAGQNIAEVSVEKIDGGATRVTRQDNLAVEEPLEIRLGYETAEGRREHKSISITMRTPGDDFELAAGFLFTEGIIHEAVEIEEIKHCGAPVGKNFLRNTVRVDLRRGVEIDFKRLERHFYTSSSCGVCGKTSIEALQTLACPVLPPPLRPVFDAALVHRLPEILREAQSVFERTGGLHAAALFDETGKLHALREDVGRHNAVDKLIGSQMLAGRVPLEDYLLLVSGRASFELVQKALMAGIPILAAVGAPSSLAVELASEFKMTLLGFVRNERFNIYTGAQRIRDDVSVSMIEARII
ncbi:MAG: formate dehydrogenase accessory sulfurtransferase FdhD [Pyrinomonadaceae bacterium]